MRVLLSPKLEALVLARVTSGMYRSSSEVVREALRAFFQAEAIRDATIKQFQHLSRPPRIGEAAGTPHAVADGYAGVQGRDVGVTAPGDWQLSSRPPRGG
jgi:putative addiction module CopG family antidote